MPVLLVMNQPVGENLTLSRADGGQLEVFPALASSLTISPARVLTGNVPALPAVPFSPGNTTGTPLAVVDITPKVSGQLVFEMTLNIVATIADQPTISLGYVDNLTAITGGTPVVGGIGTIVLEPVSVTGAAVVPVSGSSEVTGTVVEGGQQQATVVLVAPVLAVVGHRTGLVMQAFSQAPTSWTAMTLNVAVHELLA